jgi:hypothetical protein
VCPNTINYTISITTNLYGTIFTLTTNLSPLLLSPNSKKAQIALRQPHFSPYLTNSRSYCGQSNALHTDKQVRTNFYQSYKTLSPLITKLFQLLQPPNSKKAQITLSGKHFTPYITNHQPGHGQINVTNIYVWLPSNLYSSYKTLSPLLRKLFPVLSLSISKMVQMESSSACISTATTPILVQRTL